MVLAEDLRQAVLEAALQGKLTEQLETDSNVDEMLISIQEKKKRLIANKKIKKEKHLPEIQDEDIPFEIPDSWRWVRMQSLMNICSAVRVHQSDWKETGIPFFRAREIVSLDRDGYVNNDLFITEELYKKIKDVSGVPASNDLMVSGVGTLGKVYIVRDNDKFYYKDASVLCFENIGNQKSEYIKYALKSPIMVKQIHKDAMGTTVATLTIDRANAMLIPIPPIEEQQRIVDRINEIMNKIDEYEKIEKVLETLKKEFSANMKDALLQAAMQGKLTEQLESDSSADELLGVIKREKEELIEQKMFKKEKTLPDIEKEEIPFDIPKNWRWERLGNIGIYKKGPFGSALTKSMFVPKGEDTVKVYEQKNAIQKDATLGEYYITKDYFDSKMKGFFVESGDIIVSCAGTIGETYIMPNNIEIGIINQALMKMNIVPSLNINYFLIYFDNILKLEAQKGSKGSAIRNIPPFEIFKKMLIPLPPIEEQQRIVEKLEALLPLCEDLKE